MRSLLVVLMSSVLLFGCAERVAERNGISVDLVPVTYTFKAKVDKTNRDKVDKQVNEYLDTHREKVQTEQLFFTWSSELAKEHVLKTKKMLLQQGIDPQNIHVAEQSNGIGPFNLTLSLQQYQVLVPRCEGVQVNRFDFTTHDCFVEGNRWHSLQHPEKMVDNKAQYNDMDE